MSAARRGPTIAADCSDGKGVAGAETAPGAAAPESGAMKTDPTGWIVFAGATLFMVGMFDAVWGLGAILNDEAVTVGGHGVIVWDFTAWGWFHLIVGLAMIGTSVGLFMMR